MIKPLKNRVLLKRIESEAKTVGGIILPEAAKKKQDKAEVIAIGDTNLVSVGDIVMIQKYCGQEIEVDGITHVLVNDEDILGVVELGCIQTV